MSDRLARSVGHSRMILAINVISLSNQMKFCYFVPKKKNYHRIEQTANRGISERMHQYSGIRWTNWRNQRDKITQLFNILLSYREIYDIIINDKHKI